MKWLPFPFKIEEQCFYVARFEVSLQMSVKFAGSEA